MSMQDPVADMFTRIRNAQNAFKRTVEMSSSKLKVALCDVLVKEGYLESFEEVALENNKKKLLIVLKYHSGKPVIDLIKRVSRPGLRIYQACEELPKVLGGMGIVIVSTSKGLMTDMQAKRHGLGGEVMAYVA